MRLSRPLVVSALSLALAAGTATAQPQWQQDEHRWDQQRWQQQDQQQWGRQQFRGFEPDRDQWRTTRNIPQLRGVDMTLAQMGEEHHTFVRVEDGRIVSAYLDGRMVSPRDVQVRGSRVRVLDRDGEPAAIFRIPTRAQMMGMPDRRMHDPWHDDMMDRPRMMDRRMDRRMMDRPGMDDRMMDRPRMDRRMMMDRDVRRPMRDQRVFGTPEMPVADLRTSAIGILMLEAQPHHLRDTDYRRGVRIDAVQEGMPAHRAGLRRGDIIVEVEGREGVTPERLKNLLRTVPPGERLSFTVIRDGEEREVNVRTTRMLPAKVNWDYMQTGLDDQQMRQHQMMLDRHRQTRAFQEGRIYGIGLTEADEDDLDELEEFEEGLEVTYVTPGTILHEAGFRRGDIIVSVEGDADITRDDLREVLEEKEPGDTVRMQVLRNGRLHTVRIPIHGRDW